MTALYCGPPESFILDELEIGKRAATYLGNEQEGFGAWVNASIFAINLNPVALHKDWTRNPHTQADPSTGVNVTYGRTPFVNGVRRHAPTAEKPIGFPTQRTVGEGS